MDTTVLRLVSSSALQGLLDKIVGAKTLVLAPSLAGPLGLVTEVGLLKVSFFPSLLCHCSQSSHPGALPQGNGVSKMFWLENGPLDQAERNIVYLCRPEVRWMKVIAGQSPLREDALLSAAHGPRAEEWGRATLTRALPQAK